MALGLFWASIALCVFISVLALDIMGFFDRSNHFDVDGKTVVITGGSQGMGRGLAKLLAQKGANVVIVARNEKKLADAFKYIAAAAKNPARQRFNAISADLTQPGENERIIAEVTQWNDSQPPDVVWANAGSSHPTLFLETSLEIMRSQMDVNYWSAASLAQATLKVWTKPSSSTPDSKESTSKPSSSPRHFIMTSSVAAYIGLAGYAPYSPAKAALRSLTDTLRSELNLYNGMRRSKDASIRSQAPDRDVAVHIIMPGTITSPGYEHEQTLKHAVTKILEKDDTHQTEDEVAAVAVARLEMGGYMITTQFFGHVMRASMLGPGPRNSIFVDTVFSWLASLIWLFVTPDLEGKVFGYGKKHGAVDVQ